jgi:hypothetical protein
MHVLALIRTGVWFVVLGLFWYTKPEEILWLAPRRDAHWIHAR